MKNNEIKDSKGQTVERITVKQFISWAKNHGGFQHIETPVLNHELFRGIMVDPNDPFRKIDVKIDGFNFDENENGEWREKQRVKIDAIRINRSDWSDVKIQRRLTTWLDLSVEHVALNQLFELAKRK